MWRLWKADASLDLSIDPDTTVTGNFELYANLPNFSLANLTFGARDPSDRITVTQGFFQAQFACFEIYQRVGLVSPGVELFRPLGVLRQGTEIFTMNNYDEAPANIGFVFAGFDATPQSGSLTLTSGDQSGGICSSFSGSPTPNQSFVTARGMRSPLPLRRVSTATPASANYGPLSAELCAK